MPTVSIITAAYAPSAEFLPATIASVAAQKLPAGWEIEWVVQEDGAEPFLGEVFADVPNVSYAANGRQLGIAGTRNLALERANGGLLRVLDSDDLLLPDALASLIPHFLNGSIHWAVGQADDLMSDGRRVSWDPLIPTGPVPADTVNDYAVEHGGNWPIHCAGLMLRTDTVRALGGWAGTPNDEDIILFSALAEICDGYNEHLGDMALPAARRAGNAYSQLARAKRNWTAYRFAAYARYPSPEAQVWSCTTASYRRNGR